MKDLNIEREQKIGELVKSLQIIVVFAPVVETCPVQEKDINTSLLDKDGKPQYDKKAKENNKSLIMMEFLIYLMGTLKNI